MTDSIFLFHWNCDEVDILAAPLRAAGYHVETEAEDGARGGKTVAASSPAAVLFYLSRLPSHSLRTAEYLRERKSTRELPLIFIGGTPESIDSVRGKIPSGIFIPPDRLLETLASLGVPRSRALV